MGSQMLKLAELVWDNANNQCLSLRVIAEMVRTHELVVTAVSDGSGLKLEVMTAADAAARKRRAG